MMGKKLDFCRENFTLTLNSHIYITFTVYNLLFMPLKNSVFHLIDLYKFYAINDITWMICQRVKIYCSSITLNHFHDNQLHILDYFQIPYFEDVGSMTLQFMDTLFQRDNLQKSHFFKGLPKIIEKLPKV